MTDHLARLCFSGPDSSGFYTPLAFRLRLAGIQQPADHMVYLHEVHHAALNDVTAWGSALHVWARLPARAGQQFVPLLDACRTVHESLATFASVQIAAARHGALDSYLAVYPSYAPLYEATERLLRAVRGPGRLQLAASALARLCMQAPVLEEITATGLDGFDIAAIRDIDTPNGRWSWFMRQGSRVLEDAAAVADRAVVSAFGQAALDSDAPGGDLYASTDRSHDQAWEHWEAAAYEMLRTELRTTRARTLSFNGHQDGTAALLELVAARYGDIGMRAAMAGEQRWDDGTVAISILSQVRHDLSGGEPYRAVLLPATDTVAVVEDLADRPVMDGRPAMIVDARPRSRLAVMYQWPGGMPPGPLREPGEPVVAVRVWVDDGEPDGAVGHLLLPAPGDLAALSGQWRRRGLLASCVSASSLTDTGWAKRWLPAFTAAGTMFVLADVEPDRFVPAWVRSGREVVMIGIDVNDASGQRRTALVFSADQVAWWLVVAEDVTVGLVAEYLRGQLGQRLRSGTSVFGPIRDAATVAITHLLATESFVSFDAIGRTHDR